MGCYNACPRGTMTNLTGVIRKLQKERQRVHGEMGRLNAALAALGSLGSLEGKPKRSSRAQGAEAHVSGCSRKNRRGSACALGKMEEKQAEPSERKRTAKYRLSRIIALAWLQTVVARRTWPPWSGRVFARFGK